MNNIYIIYDNDIYEVSKYIKDHPGEGINNVFIKRYNGKNCTSDFDRFHMTDEPFEIIENSKKNKCCKNVKYICKNIFKSRIPKIFYFNEDDINGDLFLELNNMVLIPNNDNFLIRYKINDEIISNKIIKQDNKFLFSDDNILYESIEDIINYVKKLIL